MALDLASVPFPSEAGAPPPSKRRRLGWDVPDPALLAEAARLQFLVASQLLQEFPMLAWTVKPELTSSCKDLSDTECERIVKHGKCGAKNSHDKGCKQDLQSSTIVSTMWNEDDPDGHLNYNIGENLTSRCIGSICINRFESHVPLCVTAGKTHGIGHVQTKYYERWVKAPLVEFWNAWIKISKK